MSGHSKWSQIKRQKGVTDARRGQLFTKLAREITISAREGGGDPAANYHLRLAVQKGRDNNMPVDNIDRAIKRGTGEGSGSDSYIEVTYEGYAPGGAAVLVQALTDNKNRALAEVRKVFTHNGGTFGEPGCVGLDLRLQGGHSRAGSRRDRRRAGPGSHRRRRRGCEGRRRFPGSLHGPGEA